MELALIDQDLLSRISEYVDLIEFGSLDEFAENLNKDREFLSSPVCPGHPDSSTTLLMAVLARFRDESFEMKWDPELEWPLMLIRRLRSAGASWSAFREALIRTIPCSSTFSNVNQDKLGELLIALIMEGLEGNGELDEWAGGWLAYYLQGHAWDRLGEDHSGRARTRGVAGTGFVTSKTYNLPLALVMLGAQKDATPPWTREQYTAERYAAISKNPVLRYIVTYCGPQSERDEEKRDRLMEEIAALLDAEDDKVRLQEMRTQLESLSDNDVLSKTRLLHEMMSLLCGQSVPSEAKETIFAERLWDALYSRDLDATRKLICSVSDPERQIDALITAIVLDLREAFEILVEHGVDASQTFGIYDEDGTTIVEETNALVLSSEGGCLWAVKRLVELGVDPDYRDSTGDTAFSIAEEKEEEEVLRFLKDWQKKNPS